MDTGSEKKTGIEMAQTQYKSTRDCARYGGGRKRIEVAQGRKYASNADKQRAYREPANRNADGQMKEVNRNAQPDSTVTIPPERDTKLFLSPLRRVLLALAENDGRGKQFQFLRGRQ